MTTERTYSTNARNLAKELIRLHPGVFTVNYEENRDLVRKMIVTPSKSLCNGVAGQVTRLMVREASGQPLTVPFVASENGPHRRRRRPSRR